MLNIFKLIFTVVQEGQVRGLGGEEAHALLFRWLNEADPTLAGEVHAAPQKPFSISGVRGAGARRAEGGRHLTVPGTVHLRITSLSAPVHAVLQQVSQQLPGRTVRLGNAVLRCDRAEAVHGPTGRGWEEIWPGPASPEVSLRLHTPTSFRRQGVQIIYPEPGLVFGSLLQRYNAFAGCRLPPEWSQRLGTVRTSRYALRTEAVHFRDYTMIGCRGLVTFTAPPGNPELSALMSGLARLVPYTGVGYKVTMGLGQASYLFPSPPADPPAPPAASGNRSDP